MPVLTFIYRKKVRAFFSIERVFAVIGKLVKSQYEVKTFEAPESGLTVKTLYKNLGTLKKLQSDIYHVTGDIHYAVLALPGAKTILTIHDCIFMQQATGVKRSILKWLYLDLPVKRCRYVTTISEQSKEEIIRYTGCEASKIHVIPNPLISDIQPVFKPFNELKPTILFVGITPNKNLDRCIIALQGYNCRLEIIGRLPDEQVKALKAAALEFECYYGLTDAEVATRYQNADLVLFPSLYEGFGLPVIEGQQAGKPVITSRREPMLTVAGHDGALFVDPEDPTQIRNAVEKIVQDEALRHQLIAVGLKNIQRYSPEKIAEQYLALYSGI